ncbi:MAG: molybdopterin biosynthesis protein [Planctomycetes bacterium]|nr:molybdopterin biosynthesis protein [Planctomycetota bacterium]
MPSQNESEVREAARQQQFLKVIGRDEATERFQQHLKLDPLGTETVSLAGALNRVLASEVLSPVDVSGFDRSNVDGFALQAADTFEAMEEKPRRVKLNDEVLSPGVEPRQSVAPGTATAIATGGMVPRGAEAVVMVEHTELVQDHSEEESVLEITRAVAPGENITFAGTDIARGEAVLRSGQLLTSREIGVLAAIGLAEVTVFRKPKVAIISTGNEIVSPGQQRPTGKVYDSNLAILSAAVEELGGEPIPMGIVSDDDEKLQHALDKALAYDVVVMSGGTSKGAGDFSYRVLNRFDDPGIVAHGVALKPGKPICLAVTSGKPIVILPGFPTSAIFTFHEFVAPVIRMLAGQPQQSRDVAEAVLPMRVNSERGRTEYLLVSLVKTADGLAAYPMGKGSGSVTTYSCADGFITIDQQTEIVEAGSRVQVHLLSRTLEPADLVVIGSHCVGLDYLLGEMQRRGFSTKVLHVGSTGGLNAAKRGECDIAGIHLMDPETGEYNRPLLTPELELITGYRRMQGIVSRKDDSRFEGKSVSEVVQTVLSDPQCRMINRNSGSGTRILIDKLLEGNQPAGYAVQAKSHNAVAAAVVQNRADWGMAIDTVAKEYGLSFIPVQEEHYDFAVPKARANRPAVAAFRKLLTETRVRNHLDEMGFRL